MPILPRLRSPRALAALLGILAVSAVLAALSRPGGELEAQKRAASAPRAAQSESESPALAARLELEVAGKPEGVLALDLDLDGRDELLALSKAPGVLSVFRELPSGWKLAGLVHRFEVGDFALGPVACPRKGEPPLIALASRADHDLVLVNPLAANGEEVVACRSLGAAPRAIASGDLGADGVWEVVVIDAHGTLSIWRAGAALTEISTEQDLASCVHVLADGSGVVIGDQGALRLAFFEGTTAEDLKLVGEIALGGVPRAICELDVDGSGDRELVVAGGDRSLWTFGIGEGPNVPIYSCAKDPVESERGAIPLRLATADFSGDGATDLAVLFHGQLSYLVMSGFGGAVEEFGEYAGQAPWDMTAGDFNGDGHRDLAIANREASRVSLLFGDRERGFRQAARLATGRSPHSFAAADLDGDGDTDLVTIHSLEDSLAVLRREPNGWAREPSRPAGPGANHVRVVDLDGNGSPELAWTSTDARGSRLRFALPFEARSSLPENVEVGRSAADLCFVDLDRDGTVEALVANADERQLCRVSFAPAASRSSFETRVETIELPAAPRALAAISIENRTLLAVACAGQGVSGVALVRAGSGGALEIAHYLPVPNLPIALAVADLDGDGKDDLALLSRRTPGDGSGLLQAWIQRSLASWESRPELAVGQRPYQIAAGDLNGDGRADVVISAQNSHHLNLWLADGSKPVNLLRQADLGAGAGCLDVQLVDLDGDGAPEIVTANAFSNDLSVIGR